MRLIQIAGTTVGAAMVVACATNLKYSSALRAAQRAEDEKVQAQKEAQEARKDAATARHDAERAKSEAQRAADAQREAEDNARWATRRAAEAQQHASRATQARSDMGVTERQPDPSGPVSGAMFSVLFAPSRTDLSPEAKVSLEGVVRTLGDRKTTLHFRVHGFGDDAGTDAHNVKLSQKRAAQVADYLETKGVSPGQIMASGLASNQGAGKDMKGQDRAPFRRVDVIVEQASPR